VPKLHQEHTLISPIFPWAVWLIAAAALGIGEVLTPGLFFLGPLAVAALTAAVVAALGTGSVGGFVAFIVAAVLSIAVLRPLARRHIRMPAISRTGTAALVGKKAIVLQEVDGSGGRVKIGGEEWSARPFLDGEALHAGEHVEVAQIEGATALVLR
jgi:membrane protein implicated in regulation of membrane protease activity